MQEIKEYMKRIIANRVEMTLNSSTPSDPPSLYTALGNVIIQACLQTASLDFIKVVQDAFSEAGRLAEFASCIAPHIVNGDITSISPPLLYALSTHPDFEGIVCGLDVACLDFDWVLKEVSSRSLLNSLFYIYSVGLHDYIGPLVLVFQL